MAMKVIFVDCTPELQDVIEKARLEVPENIEIHTRNPEESEMLALCERADVVLVEHTSVPSSLFQKKTKPKEIVFMGTGASSYIDLRAAANAGVRVSTISNYGDQAVAEHTLALMFAGARKIAEMDRTVRLGRWAPLSGMQLQGKKLAVIGLGGIGIAVAELGKALGMQVSGWNRTRRSRDFYEPDIEAALHLADIVSLHLALNAETRGLMNEKSFGLPKHGFLLVNTARAALVDAIAMSSALQSGRIGHAALDVFEDEPLPSTDPLLACSNVTLTAHAAYMTEEAYQSLWSKALEHVRRIGADSSQMC
jgi:D-3-phosphoglycerate dehydrogenase